MHISVRSPGRQEESKSKSVNKGKKNQRVQLFGRFRFPFVCKQVDLCLQLRKGSASQMLENPVTEDGRPQTHQTREAAAALGCWTICKMCLVQFAGWLAPLQKKQLKGSS